MGLGMPVRYPAGPFQTGDRPASFRALVARVLNRAFAPVVTAAASTTHAPTVAAAYDVVQRQAGAAVLVGVINYDPLWPFIEYDTRPHMPPTLPRGKLSFPAARTIARQGTKGQHNLALAWQAERVGLVDAVFTALARWWGAWGVDDGR